MPKEEMSITLANDCHLGKAGQTVQLELTPSDVHDPTEIPSYLAGYKPFAMRADEMSPVLLVDNDEDKFRSFDEGDAFEPVNVKRATTAAIPEISPRSALNNYKVVDRFVGSFVPWHVENQTGNNYQPRMAAARRCSRAIMLDRELDVLGPSGLLTTVTNWAADVRITLIAGREWLNTGTGLPGADSNPIKDIQDAVEKSHQPVTEVLMNQRVANAMIRHPEVRDHMRQLLGDGAANGVTASLATAQTTGNNVDILIPGLPPIKVSGAKYRNSAGATTYVMPDRVLLLTIIDSQPTDGEEIATSYTFRRRGPSGTGYNSREFQIENRGPHGGTMVVVSLADQAVMTGSNCGGVIDQVVQS